MSLAGITIQIFKPPTNIYMTNVLIALELGKTSMLLQDSYSTVRRKENELEALKSAHSEELTNLKLEIESLKTQLLLMQMLMNGALPKPDKGACANDDEYTV